MEDLNFVVREQMVKEDIVSPTKKFKDEQR
jgi:hypothetical protein